MTNIVKFPHYVSKQYPHHVSKRGDDGALYLMQHHTLTNLAPSEEWDRLAALAAEPVDPTEPPAILSGTAEEEAEREAKIEKARRYTVDGLTDPDGFKMLARYLPNYYLANATPAEIAEAVTDMANLIEPVDEPEQFSLADLPTEN